MKLSRALLKAAVIIFISAFVAAFQSCGERPESDGTARGGNIVLIAKERDSSYWKTVQMGADAAAKEFEANVQFFAPARETDVKGQLALMEDALNNHNDAIILAAGDYEAFSPLIQKASSLEIPVIAIDSGISSRAACFIAADNRYAGRKAAGELVKVSGDRCRVAIVSSVEGAENSREREDGLNDVIGGYPGIKVIGTKCCQSDEELASKLAMEIMGDGTRVDAFVTLDGKASMGVAGAVREAGLDSRVKVIAFDTTPELIDLLEDGTIQAMIVQNPFSMGYLGVKYALDAIDGREVPERVDTGVKVINSENMYLPENQKLLFPFY